MADWHKTDWNELNPVQFLVDYLRRMSANATQAAWLISIDKCLSQTVPMVLLVLGITGHLLSLAVCCRRSLRRLVVTTFIGALALTDSLVLLVGLGRHWTIAIGATDLRNASQFLCKAHRFMLYTVLDVSAWLLVVIAVERYTAVCQPARINLRFSLKRSRFYVAAVIALGVLKNLHVFGTYSLSYTGHQMHTGGIPWTEQRFNYAGTSDRTPNRSVDEQPRAANQTWREQWGATMCKASTPEAEYFLTDVLPWIATGVYVLGPFAVMSVLNVLTLRGMQRSTERMRQYKLKKPKVLVLDPVPLADTPLPATRPLLSAPSTGALCEPSRLDVNYAASHGSFMRRCRSVPCLSDLPAPNAAPPQPRPSSHSSITLMLLTSSWLFMLLTAPSFINHILETYYVDQMRATADGRALHKLLSTCVLMMMYLNHAINFLVYVLTGRRFRQELYCLLRQVAQTIYHPTGMHQQILSRSA